jgi:sRNA-binding carbon storage regulator CsrA
MLCLSRKNLQVISIRHAGECLRIVVREIGRGSVRLAFDAPPSFEILRDDAKHRSPARPGEEDLTVTDSR